jgi:hypothetical protein
VNLFESGAVRGFGEETERGCGEFEIKLLGFGMRICQ